MGPAVSHRISRVLRYSGFHGALLGSRVRVFHLLWKRFPTFSASFALACVMVLLPQSCLDMAGLGWSAFARHYLRNHCYFLFLRVLRCFSSPRLLTAWQYTVFTVGCPIRRSADRRLFAPPRGFSQLIASFVAFESLGILHAPLFTFFPACVLADGPYGSMCLLLCSCLFCSFPICQGSFLCGE